MLKKIFFYRHGERSDLAPIERRISYNIMHDPPLTDLGHLESVAAAEHILTLIPENSSVKLVSSPLLRCVQTLSKLALLLKLPIHTQLGFGESFQEYVENPFNYLHISHKKDDFPINVELIHEASVIDPCVPETLPEATDRMKIMKENYMPNVNCEYLIICTHLYPIWGMLNCIGTQYDEKNSHFTQITEIEYEMGEYIVTNNGDYRHLARLYNIN